MEKADKLKSSFTGDPSFFAFDGEGEIENPEDEVIFNVLEFISCRHLDLNLNWLTESQFTWSFAVAV